MSELPPFRQAVFVQTRRPFGCAIVAAAHEPMTSKAMRPVIRTFVIISGGIPS